MNSLAVKIELSQNQGQSQPGSVSWQCIVARLVQLIPKWQYLYVLVSRWVLLTTNDLIKHSVLGTMRSTGYAAATWHTIV